MRDHEVRTGELLLASTTSYEGDHYYVVDADSLAPRVVSRRDADFATLASRYGIRGLAQRYRHSFMCVITTGRAHPEALVLRWTGYEGEVVIDEHLEVAVVRQSPRAGRLSYSLRREGQTVELELSFRGAWLYALSPSLLSKMEAEEENILLEVQALSGQAERRSSFIRQWTAAPQEPEAG